MWEGHSAWHVDLPQRGIEPTSLPAVEMRVLTAGPSGKSNNIHFMLTINYAPALGFCFSTFVFAKPCRGADSESTSQEGKLLLLGGCIPGIPKIPVPSPPHFVYIRFLWGGQKRSLSKPQLLPASDLNYSSSVRAPSPSDKNRADLG